MYEWILNLTRVEILTIVSAFLGAMIVGSLLGIRISLWRERRKILGIRISMLRERMTKRQRQAQSRENLEPKIDSPAATAELILHILLKDDEAEAVGGDLQERYSKKVERFGNRRAYIWLWSQVLRSIWPLLKRFFTAGGFLAAAEFIRRLLS